jgi:predicted AAA+ superfamily ATPase
MINRASEIRLIKLAKQFRSVAVIGPRQSGKTTLCKKVFPTKPYVSLENPDTLAFATEDPRGFLAQFTNGAILDEIQRVPKIFSYLQQILDETKKRGLFILSGSNNFLLQENISQSLAGRIAYITLLPLSIAELSAANKLEASFQQTIFKGGYPEVIAKKVNAVDWFNNYIQTYIERDVRLLKNITNLSLFLKFIKLCAGRVGSNLNIAAIANDCGIDQKTAGNWMSILEASFIVYLLKPYYANLNKRLTKSSKLYFYDTGLACALLNINHVKSIQTNAYTGHLFENLMVIEALKYRMNMGLMDNLYFIQDKTGNEIDLILEEPKLLRAYECKSSATINNDYFKGLLYFNNLGKLNLSMHLIYGGIEAQKRTNTINIQPWFTQNMFQ